ncbi:Serine/threonine-protein kinase Sgk2 [Coemansia sp. Benny D115]|nr:Serine/threonine-protein kinase Sgk2 [Coemansia sp. Benny D115]
MDTNAGIPSALRHLLARGAQNQAQTQTPHQHMHNHQNQHQHQNQQHYDDSAGALQPPQNHMYSTYSTHSATSSATALQSPASSTRLTSPKSTGNLKSGSSLGAWLSKYHLRPGAARPQPQPQPQTQTQTQTQTQQHQQPQNYQPTKASSSASTASIDSYGNPHSAAPDFARSAYITSVETRDSGTSGAPGELRVGGLRMGRKRFLVYRIQVTGSRGHQWWIARRYSEFHDLFQALRRLYPQQASQWSELFPGKRLIPGLGNSTDSGLHRRERLNAFLRALTQDTAACRSAAMQQFLRDDPIDVDAVPLADRMAAGRETQQGPNYGLVQPLSQQQQQQQSKRSISSGSALGGIDHSALYAQWQMPLPDSHWQHTAPRPGPKARESLERMASMPSLKSATAVQPTFDFSIPVPALPLTGYASVGVTGGRSVVLPNEEKNPPAAEPITMHRKISDPMEYASAEKRPNHSMPQSMRKKYGLRRNMQYRSDRVGQMPFAKAPPASADSASHGMSFMQPPDTAATLLPWDGDYVMVDEASDSNMEVDRTLRSGSVDSDADFSTGRSAGDLGHKRGRSMATPRRAPLGGIGKNRRTPNDDPAVVASKVLVRGGGAKRQNASVSESGKRSNPTNHEDREDDDTDEDADGGADRTKNVNGPQKVGLDDFQLLSIIGKGSYGKVMLARYKDTGKVMAIKVISKSKLRGRPNEIRRVMSERKVLERTVKHPFLVGLQCAFQTKEKLFFCLDYVNGGELFFHLQRERRFGENRARFYAAEIASALAYLHGMDVVYRDLKPENCLLDARGHVRIVDFGLAKEVGPVVWRTEGSALYSVEEGGKTGTFCGTPEYLAPEVLLRQRYGKEVDWYCLGAVLYEMLTGLPPFYHQDNNTMYQRILSENLRFPTALPPPSQCNGELHPGSGNVACNSIGRYAQDFVFRIMDRDPQRRLGHGIFGTENVKRHVFFHGIDWGKIYRQEYAPPFIPKVSSIFDLSNIDPEFRNEPIPASILAEGQVDILAEAAEAERQAELALQAQLAAFPSPVSSPAAKRLLFSDKNKKDQAADMLLHNESLMAAMAAAKRNAEMDSTINAFRGFSFVSPWVDAPDND